LQLSKNAHWLFDQGLWTVGHDLRVIVAHGAFAEDSPDGPALAHYHGKALRLPEVSSAWPNRAAFGMASHKSLPNSVTNFPAITFAKNISA